MTIMVRYMWFVPYQHQLYHCEKPVNQYKFDTYLYNKRKLINYILGIAS